MVSSFIWRWRVDRLRQAAAWPPFLFLLGFADSRCARNASGLRRSSAVVQTRRQELAAARLGVGWPHPALAGVYGPTGCPERTRAFLPPGNVSLGGRLVAAE